MEEPIRALPLYAIRYLNHGQVCNITSRGETGWEAFTNYLETLNRQGEQSGTYHFIRATRIEPPDNAVDAQSASSS